MTDLSYTEIQWTAFDLLTGQIIMDSQQIGWEASTPLLQSIGQMETANLTFNVDETTPSEWTQATTPGGSGWVAWLGSPASPVILWGGIVTQRVRTLSTQINLQLSTLEAYLDGLPMGQYSAISVNQDAILNQIMTQFVNNVTTGALAGMSVNIPTFALIPSGVPSTATQTWTYTANPNVTVLGALQAVSSVLGGPQWLTGWSWNLSAGTITPTFTYGQQVGAVVPAGLAPAVTIDLNDLRNGSQFTEDFSAGYGANVVVALGSAQSKSSNGGAVTSGVAYAGSPLVAGGLPGGRPAWVYTYNPNAQVSSLSVLNSYAAGALRVLQSGNQPIVAVLDIHQPGKQYGVDWNIGDFIGWSFGGVKGMDLQFPTAVVGSAQVIGVQITPATITPVLAAVGALS